VKIFLLLLVVFSGFAFAQDYTVNCSTVGPSSEGCTSYNEMVKKKDKDIVDLLGYHTLKSIVCFRPHSDGFFIIQFTRPEYRKYTKSTSGLYEAPTTLGYSLFQDGQMLDFEAMEGMWTTTDVKTDPPMFKAGEMVHMNENEVFMIRSYKNEVSLPVEQLLRIRLSTLRFVESFKVTKMPDNSKDPATWENNGRCAEF
jgi:hypothetical protein